VLPSNAHEFSERFIRFEVFPPYYGTTRSIGLPEKEAKEQEMVHF